ncbi:MAG: UDP-3-O-(3-hydroxymyristoyl)glucosamine N-acyltransferase [Mariprofundaceae bacterium]|nr:UDP-3-O-(3-hydroxymyristoyl)glucosamine N-acyltransferase [Mariprofundaceae bacterium]
MPRTLCIEGVVALLGGRLQGGNSKTVIVAVNTLKNAQRNEISFLTSQRYKQDLFHSHAAAVLVSESIVSDLECDQAVICVADPYLAFATLQRYFHPNLKSSGIRHATAYIDESADIADDVDIAAACVIAAGVKIDSGTRLEAGCLIAEGVHIGHECLLHAGVKIEYACKLHNRVIIQAGAVIGSDGFGYAWTGQKHLKIPQVGCVVLHDDVEIGANTCIDRGALSDTVIQQGVKLDNLIQIGHNVDVGPLTVMASQVGISGSTTIGKGCQLGGQTGVAGHLTIGDGCQIAGQTGVIGDLEAGGVYAGMPAVPHRMWLKTSALVMRLPEIWKKIKKIP